MNKRHWLLGAAAVAAIALNLGIVGVANSQRAADPIPLPRDVAKKSGVGEDVVIKVLNNLGPAAAAQLAAGKEVSFSGMGTLRVVRVPDHRDMQDGRPVTVAAYNFVEFIPDAALNQAANKARAVPAVIVEPFQYVPLPDQTPGQRVPSVRMPYSRIR